MPSLFHLPGLDLDLGTNVAASSAPELVPEQVERVWGTLDQASVRWRAQDLGARIERLAAIAAGLRARGPGRWRGPLELSTGLSAPGLEAAWDATFSPCDPEALRAAAAAGGIDSGSLVHLDSQGRMPRRVLHVVPGNVMPATFTMLVRGWLLGAAQWLRPSAGEPFFAACLAEALGDLAADLAMTFAVLWWPHAGSRSEVRVFAGAQIVTAQGDDASVQALGDKVARCAPEARFVGYGSRWSAALVSCSAQTPESARALAWDVALFDQQGCLSPSLVLAERGPDLESWCASLAGALADLEASLPRGPLPAEVRAGIRRWRESVRLGAAGGEVAGLWESRGTTAWAVALLAGCRYEESPLWRHAVVVPFANLGEIRSALGERLERLQGLAVALSGWDAARRREALEMLRPCRSAPPGRLQLAPPGWEQDHIPPLRGLML